MTMKIDWMSIEDDFQAEAAYFWLRREGGLPAARHFHHPAEAPSFPAERSFGVRAASCRFPSRKLACGSSFSQACLREFLPASSLAGISNPALICIRISSLQARMPASELAGEKVAASCTHSQASLRVP